MADLVRNQEHQYDFSKKDKFVFNTTQDLNFGYMNSGDGEQEAIVWAPGFSFFTIVHGISEDEKAFFESSINSHNDLSEIEKLVAALHQDADERAEQAILDGYWEKEQEYKEETQMEMEATSTASYDPLDYMIP